MKVSGFSFIKNAVKYDYPVLEAVQSVLPLCDEFVIAVGDSDDGTIELIESLKNDKIKIIKTVWDETQRKGGKVFALETDKAFAEIAEDSDWAFYIQGDEVLHEKYHHTIREAMEKYKDVDKVDGLLFKYEHFYGSFDYVGASSNWYPHEIRVIKNNKTIYSYRDAQGFRKGDNEKLNVIPIDAYIYHYGWVREPQKMQSKQINFRRLQRGDDWVEKESEFVDFDYEAHVTGMRKFEGTHPEIMIPRVQAINWKFDHDVSFSKLSMKDKTKKFLSKIGIHVGYRNYKIIKG
jgi:glycosyltransferase involved in cell wall biosynthesis